MGKSYIQDYVSSQDSTVQVLLKDLKRSMSRIEGKMDSPDVRMRMLEEGMSSSSATSSVLKSKSSLSYKEMFMTLATSILDCI
jgi:hypothetical protein